MKKLQSHSRKTVCHGAHQEFKVGANYRFALLDNAQLKWWTVKVLVIGGPQDVSASPAKPEFFDSNSFRPIRKRGALRVGVSFDEPNLAWRNERSSELQGLEIDLARRLTEWVFGCALNSVWSHLELVEMESADRTNSLVENGVDVVISNFADTAKRRKDVTFAGYYLATKFAPLILKSSSDVSDVTDLADKTVTVVSGTTGEELLRRLAPSALVVPRATVTECLEAVITGRADACWTTTAGNVSYVSDHSAVLKQAELKAGSEHWAMGVNKSSDDMARCVNDLVARMLATGELTRLLRRWLPDCT